MAKEPLRFGFVRVTRGADAGRVGYYDDDDDDQKAIVYFDEPLVGSYRVIAKRLLENTSVSTLAAQRFKRRFPGLVKKFGIEI